MFRFFMLLVALFLVSSVTAFTSKPAVSAIARGSVPSSPFAAGTSSTTLHLKVKVDTVKVEKSKKINPGAFKGAAYGGSIAIAVLLPIAFLVWAATK
jgi:hypothetical protein